MPRALNKPAFNGTIYKFFSSKVIEENPIEEEKLVKVDVMKAEEIKTELVEEKGEDIAKKSPAVIDDSDNGKESRGKKKTTENKRKIATLECSSNIEKDYKKADMQDEGPTAKKTKRVKQEEDENNEKKPKKAVAKKVKEGETEEQKLLRETVGKDVLNTVGKSQKMLGYHVSAAGSVEQSIYNAVSTGCRSFALFIRNQRTWKHKPMEEEKVVRWKAAMEETRFDVNQILPHGSYLMNPGCPDNEKLSKTREAMLDECQRCERLGIKLYNFHPGSTIGECTRDECIKIVAETINYVMKHTSSIVLVIETMAGQGNTVGGKFAEIRSMIDQVNNKDRIGVCIDTCHIFAAGDLGCHLDRHEHIGKGKIGKKGFELLMNDSRLNGIPMVLETPEGQYPEEMKLMYGMDAANTQAKP